MCGIAGLIRLQGRIVERDRTAVVRMLRAEAHRGPDGEHLTVGDTVCLGHRRLAIIDLSDNARQPMTNETANVWVSANGEIYNFRELRAELESFGHAFESRTDIEVLVHGYEQWGIDGLLSRLRGMFAFALYDARRAGREKLFLVRDRFGIKPLYYARRGETLVFASELRALVASGLVAAQLDPRALASFLELGSIPGPGTALKGVETLPAAHYLELSGGRVALERYWRLAAAGDGISEGDASEISEILAESVRLHLVSDVPLGVFSSGGIDSATLVALASRDGEVPLTTLSVVFDDSGISEARYARAVAARYRTDHREISVDADDFLKTLPSVFDAMDSPSVDGVNTYFVSRAAKQAGLTVVLTGLGGDEVFLGYPHHKTLSRLAPFAAAFARLPRSVRSALTRAGRAVSGKDRLDYLAEPSADNVYRMFRGLFSPRQVARLVSESVAVGTSPASLGEGASHDLLDAAVRLEFEHYLQHQLLRDTDGMSMAHSIEARVPFLDHRLVEAVYRLPHASKLARGINKPLLLKALADPLPREVWDRPKQGFTFPFRRFLLEHRGELRERAQSEALFRPGAVDAVWDEFDADRAHWSRPWALVAFTAWLERLQGLAIRGREVPVLAAIPPR
jgi:asparagine synthase (glutamine-hydrolysing)